MSLEKYKASGTCKKCGYGPGGICYTQPQSEYQAPLMPISRRTGDLKIIITATYNYAVMLRKCCRCGYTWEELPLDHENEL